jgi:hypothetical protein
MTGVDSDTSQDIAEAISLKGGRYVSRVPYSAWGKPVYCGSGLMKSDPDLTFQAVWIRILVLPNQANRKIGKFYVYIMGLLQDILSIKNRTYVIKSESDYFKEN